jgi:hypothetical protein
MESQAGEFPGLPTMPIDEMLSGIKIVLNVLAEGN